MIWQLCPKTSGSGRRTAEIEVYEAATLFNKGQKGRLNTMRKLELHPGINCVSSQLRADFKVFHAPQKRQFLIRLMFVGKNA